jgi:hypothetical protein
MGGLQVITSMHLRFVASEPRNRSNRTGGAADAGRADGGGGPSTDPPRSCGRATSHVRSCSRVPLPASPLPASDQNQHIVRAPATTPDHDTPQASGRRLLPDQTPSKTSSRWNSFLLIDTTGTAHLGSFSNLGQCHINFAEGCHFYIAPTSKCRVTAYGK